MEKKRRAFRPREAAALKVALFFLLVFYSPARANDFAAAIESGNLVIKKSDGIVMVSEDLFLSKDLVKVEYIFHNTTSKDIQTLVAFPVTREDYGLDAQGKLWQDPHLPKNIDFKIWGDGKLIPTKIERTTETKKSPYLDIVTFYWEQRFPAGKKVAVKHTYKPGVGGFFFDPNEDHYEAVRDYCIDPGLKKSLKKVALKYQGIAPAISLHYILSTAKSWRGPIQNFRMVLDKGKPETLISLCIEGIRKISPTQFEAAKKNFTPKQDLRIVFFEQ